jgi:hypothetical protein
MATLRRHTSSSSDWGDIVKTCVSGGRRILVKMTGLGGLLGLFFSIDESDTSNYLWDQFEALEPAPMLLGFQAELKDHSQCCDT